MEPHTSFCAVIPPVPANIPRPLWSIMIPTYNCANYLRETLMSVLAQDLGPDVMQIEVVDDCSMKDDPQAIVEEVGKGRVSFYRQPQNVGHTRNFETCLQRSRGHLIHLLHGDDYIGEGFYQKMQTAFEKEPEIGAAFCRHIFIDEHSHWQSISSLEQLESGILPNWLEKIAVGQRIQTPSIVVRREVYEKLGGFDQRLSWCEDWEMWIRIANCYPVWYESSPLAFYRQHSNSNSGRYIKTGENVQDLYKALDIIYSYLSQYSSSKSIPKLLKKARKNITYSSLDRAHIMFCHNDIRGGFSQTREALKKNLSLSVLIKMSRVLINVSRYQLIKFIRNNSSSLSLFASRPIRN